MKVEARNPADLKPHPRNSRKHTQSQIAALSRAILKFGFTQPVVITPEGMILIGHARTRAAVEAGLSTIPVIVREMDEAQARALVISDNRLHEFGATWDEGLRDAELRGIMAAGFDVTLTGFDAPDPVPSAGEPDEDEIPEDEIPPVSEQDDIWILGQHRLHVGDSTNPETLANALSESPAIMVTDPPYGVNYDPDWRNHAMRKDGSSYGGRATGTVMNDDRADWSDVWAAFAAAGGRIAYVWHAGTQAQVVEHSLVSAGFEVRAQIAWVKQRHVIGRGHYHHQHEPCFYATRGKGRPAWRGPAISTCWEISHARNHTGHGTQKPVEAMRRPILTHTKPGALVFDPFAGSGSTIIAAEATGRRARAIELSPAYADVIVNRWARYSGGKPKLLRDGEIVPYSIHDAPESGVSEL